MNPILSIVIPLRNRPVTMTKLTLDTVLWQDPAYPVEIILVSNGNTDATNEALASLSKKYGTKLITFNNHPVWNKSLTSNVGIRNTSEESKYVMTMDTDMLLQPNFFTALFATEDLENSFVTCRVGTLPDDVEYPDLSDPANYQILYKQGKWSAPHHGIGGIQCAPRKFWFDVRGYEEDIIYWGSMDSDMADRAARYGLKRQWLNKHTSMLHQVHVKRFRNLKDPKEQKAAQKAHFANKKIRFSRAKIVVRNPSGWGEV